MEKEALRDILREYRWSIPPLERDRKSRKITEYLRDIITTDEQILVYCAKQPEVETCWFIRHLIDAQIPVIVPIIEPKTTSLRLSYLKDTGCLVQSTFSVPEPVGSEIPANPADVTSAIIPMLGFDKNGGRLGYGAGYYDRFLSQHRHIRTIGIAYSNQETHALPIDDNDIGMDVVVTEKGIMFMNLERR